MEEPLRFRVHEHPADIGAAGGLSHEGHAIRISAVARDRLFHPAERFLDIGDREVPRGFPEFGERQEPKRPKPILDRHHDHTGFRREPRRILR